MQPIRRNKQFKLDLSKSTTWHQAGEGVSQFFNAMSLFFPAGERYFIRSVRAFSDKTPLEMKEAVSAFIGQEAFHGREHEKLNAAIVDYRFSILLEQALIYLSEKLPREYNLAATCALEHVTSILAQALLEDVRFMVDSDPEFRDLWIWHALEETEHKAVAFDQFRAVVKNPVYAYVLRSVTLVIATLIFLAAVAERYMTLLHKNKQLTFSTVWGTLYWLLWKPGTMTKCIPLWLSWFRPGFHPWNHDNSHELRNYAEFLSCGTNPK